MNDTPVMSAHERTGNLNAIAHDRLWRQPHLSAHRAQRLAFDQLHYDVEVAVRLADFVDSADVGMSERRRGTRFMEQFLACRCIQASAFLDNFQGHIAVQDFVMSAIDNPHSSFPNLRHDTAMT